MELTGLIILRIIQFERFQRSQEILDHAWYDRTVPYIRLRRHALRRYV